MPRVRDVVGFQHPPGLATIGVACFQSLSPQPRSHRSEFPEIVFDAGPYVEFASLGEA